MQPSFSFRDLRGFADPSDARSYYYLPTSPDLRRDGQHQPMITLVDVGASAHVMFTATWSPAVNSVETLRGEIARGHREDDASRFRLAFAPLSSVQCRALVADDAGTYRTIATSATSGMPPYDALFNLAVAGEPLASVRRAISGERGFFGIEYVADLLVPFTAAAGFRSTVETLVPWLRARRAGGAPLRTLLEEAVEEGVATVTIDAPDEPGARIALELFDRVLSQAAQAAARWIDADGTGDIDVHVALDRDAREPVRAFADIGGILASGPRPS